MFTGPRSCILNETTFTKYYLTQWISKLPVSRRQLWFSWTFAVDIRASNQISHKTVDAIGHPYPNTEGDFVNLLVKKAHGISKYQRYPWIYPH